MDEEVVVWKMWERFVVDIVFNLWEEGVGLYGCVGCVFEWFVRGEELFGCGVVLCKGMIELYGGVWFWFKRGGWEGRGLRGERCVGWILGEIWGWGFEIGGGYGGDGLGDRRDGEVMLLIVVEVLGVEGVGFECGGVVDVEIVVV